MKGSESFTKQVYGQFKTKFLNTRTVSKTYFETTDNETETDIWNWYLEIQVKEIKGKGLEK